MPTRPEDLSPSAAAHLARWRTDPEFVDFHHDVEAFLAAAEPQAVEDAFRGLLPFGTAGRRGPEGVGPNRFNARTLAESAAGLAHAMTPAGLAPAMSPAGLAIVGYDARRNSAAYARLAAEVLAGAGWHVLLFDAPCATPQLAFEVQRRSAGCGAMITASHNPPCDNGFKAYAAHGGQLVPPDDERVMACVAALADAPLPRSQTGIELLDAGQDDAYLAYVAGQSVTDARGARLVFSPLQGVGGRTVMPVLARAGFTDLHWVESQRAMSPEFDAVPGGIANPEQSAALRATMATCRAVDADLGLAADPDADRLGAVARDAAGEWRVLSGQTLAALIVWHTCSARAAHGTLPADAVLLTSVVGSDLARAVAADFGVEVRGDFPIGFKWFGEVLGAGLEAHRLVAAVDESHGFNRGALVRDKDAASAALAMAELTADLRRGGLTIPDQIDLLESRHGVHEERVLGLRMERLEAVEALFARWRTQRPARLGGLAVAEIEDRLANPWRNPVTGALLPDDFLLLHLRGDDARAVSARLALRRSGTEPKLKVYVHARRAVGVHESLREVRAGLRALADSLAAELLRGL